MVERLSSGEALQYTKKHKRHKSDVAFVPPEAFWFATVLVRSVAFV